MGFYLRVFLEDKKHRGKYMGVSILYPKNIFYKGPKSPKNHSKTYVLTSGTLKKRFLSIFSYILNLESSIFIGFRQFFTDFGHFWHFSEKSKLIFQPKLLVQPFQKHFKGISTCLWSIHNGLSQVPIKLTQTFHTFCLYSHYRGVLGVFQHVSVPSLMVYHKFL